MGTASKKRVSRPAQVTVILRLIAGGYLIYLAFGLGKEMIVSAGGRQLLQAGFLAVFLAVGGFLAGWSLKKLVRGEFLRPGESEEDYGEDDKENGEEK